MKYLTIICVIALAFFFSCDTKPGARAKVDTTRQQTTTTAAQNPSSVVQTQTSAPAPGEEFFQQSMHAYESGNKQESFNLCLKSAELGFAPAQFNVAIFYYNGDGVKKDLAKTVDWLEKAAKQDYLLAQKQLAVCYAQGIGIKKDPKQAAYWYEKAANQGDADAQYKLGTAYYQGNGVLPDYEQAVKWYEKAAAQGVSEAINDLGFCYENGLGVTKIDPNKALQLYERSTALGNKIAKSNFDRLKKTLEESKTVFEM